MKSEIGKNESAIVSDGVVDTETDFSIPLEVQNVVAACLSHAEDLLSAAAKIQGERLPNIAYHLATLALEEIGKAGLELEKCFKPRRLSEQEQEDMAWFLNAAEDPEKRGMILGQKSMEKIVELGQTSAWIHWLREQFEQAEMEARALSERELKRARPSDDESEDPKWRLKIRLYTNSHSIRPKSLNYWKNVSEPNRYNFERGRHDKVVLRCVFSSNISASRQRACQTGGMKKHERPTSSYRSSISVETGITRFSAREERVAWAYLDAAHLVGAAVIGGVVVDEWKIFEVAEVKG